jgi:hypothetical protein
MRAIDRRGALHGILGVVITASLAASTLPKMAEATPLALDRDLARELDDLREKPQPVASRPLSPAHRRHRRTAAGCAGGTEGAVSAAGFKEANVRVVKNIRG